MDLVVVQETVVLVGCEVEIYFEGMRSTLIWGRTVGQNDQWIKTPEHQLLTY